MPRALAFSRADEYLRLSEHCAFTDCVCACAVLVLELWIPSYATAEATVCTQPDPHEGRELFLVLLHPPRARVEAAAAR